MNIYTRDGLLESRTFEGAVRISDIVRDVKEKLMYDVYCARIDQRTVRLNECVTEDCDLELLDLRSFEGNMVYQTSLKLMYMKAVHDVVGPVFVEVHNSLSKGLFTTLKTGSVTEENVRNIEARMKQLVEEALPMDDKLISALDGMKKAQNLKRDDVVNLLDTAYDVQGVHSIVLKEEEDIAYYTIVPDTSYLKYFRLKRYKNGIILIFPHPVNPSVVPVFAEQKLLYNAFSEESRWERIMGVEEASDLNRLILNNEIGDLILFSEALHEKKIAEIAQEIKDKKKRIILIAGPSSSGKTTFAKRLCIQLRVVGLKPLYLGTDDYFKERKDNPLDGNGKPDYETIDALDRTLFNAQMNDLLSGKSVDIPTFNFLTGEKEFGKRVLSIADTQPIVIEGLHCLNPVLTENIEDDEKYKIYISPLTQMNIDKHNRIPTTDARLLRRIVRDASFRGFDAKRTINMWPSVRKGEEKHTFPYNDQADVFFNSSCLYEMAVLKLYAEPQLKKIRPGTAEYPEAQRILRLLQFFVTIEDPSMIPNNSLLREFIGGSVIAH